MQKLKRILALIGVVLILGMYLVTLYLGLTASPETKNVLMASIVCTILLPCVLYSCMLVTKVLENRRKEPKEKETEDD